MKNINDVPMPERVGKLENLDDYKNALYKKLVKMEAMGLLDDRQIQKLAEAKHRKLRRFWCQEEVEEHEASLISNNICYWCRGRYRKV